MTYAGFWKRFAAMLIDWIIIMMAVSLIGFVFGLTMFVGGMHNPHVAEVPGNMLGLALMWLYYSVMESSPLQGTLGKMALGIKVTDLQGERVGFGKATGRFFGKIISCIILFIGFLMAAFTEKKQALHDMMAGCLVVNKSP